MGAVSHHKIREFRKRKGLTMQALASAIGTSQQQIDRLEKGQRRLTVDWLDRLSRALDCSVLELLPPSLQRDCGERTAKAKVIGEINRTGGIKWWGEEDRYSLVFGRPEGLKNARLFAVRVGADADIPEFPVGTELVFSQVMDAAESDDDGQGNWVICGYNNGSDGVTLCHKDAVPISDDVRVIRARLIKSLRNE